MKISRFFSYLAILSIFCLIPRTAFSQKICDPDDGKSCVTPIVEGEPAPFSGQLLSARKAAKLAVLAGGCQERIDLAVDREKSLYELRLAGERALRDSDRVGAKLKEDLLLRRMAEMEQILTPPWYERPAIVSAVTAVASIAVLAVAVKTVQTLK